MAARDARALAQLKLGLFDSCDAPLGRAAGAPPGDLEGLGEAVQLVFCVVGEGAAGAGKLYFFAEDALGSSEIEPFFLAHDGDEKELLEDFLCAGNHICFVVPPSVAVIIREQSLERGKVSAFDGCDESRLRAADLTLWLEPPPQREGRTHDYNANPHAEFLKKSHE